MFGELALAMSLFSDPRSLAARADALMLDAKAEQALAAYDEAISRGSSSARIAYNRACALRALGRIEEAEEGFQEAWRTTTDRALAGDAAFNLGHSLFQRAAAAKPEERGAAMDLFRRASGAFLEASRAAPDDLDALRNLELARRSLRALEEEQRREEEERQQQEQRQQELADALQELAKRQQELADESARTERTTQEQVDRAHSEQDELGDSTQEFLDQLGEESGEEVREAVRRAREDQEASEGELRSRDSDGAAQRQGSAAAELRRALEALRERMRGESSGSPSQEPPADAQPQEQEAQPEPPSEASQDPQQRLMEQLLERERAERAQRSAAMRRGARVVPVEKDW